MSKNDGPIGRGERLVLAMGGLGSHLPLEKTAPFVSTAVFRGHWAKFGAVGGDTRRREIGTMSLAAEPSAEMQSCSDARGCAGEAH